MNKTLDYFKEISKIPRCSAKEQNIANYLCNFAKIRGLEFYKDSFNNVIIKKQTSSCSPIMLQAHTDMVCVKSKNSKYDFDIQGIEVLNENGYLHAIDTSLGADNGIGVAMILSILDENFPMNIEAVFTTEEETTMNGASNLDYSKLKAKHILSLDGSEQNEIITSSASMSEIEVVFENVIREIEPCQAYHLEIHNFKSGHSGDDVDKVRLNPISLFFDYFEDKKIVIHDINLEVKSNVLPSEINVTFSDDTFDLKKFECYIQRKNKQTGENIITSISKKKVNSVLDVNYVNELKSFKNGVIKKDGEDVICSCNIYLISPENNKIKLSLRCNKKSLQKEFLQELKNHFKNSKINILDNKPFFEKSKKNSLLNTLLKTNKNSFEKSIHAGLEGGIFAENIKDCEICVIGATILDMHTINERVSFESIKNVYDWLVKTLKNIDF